MPIELTVDHANRTARAVCSGVVTLADLEAYFDAATVAGARSFPKLFDLANADLALSDAEMLLVGARISAYRQSAGPIGPVAIVAATEKGFDYARHFASIAPADRPLLVFRDMAAARRWLDSLPR